MAYKISGTKTATARITILKESDWSIESNTVVSGSGSYAIEGLTSGYKTVVARTTEGETLGYGYVDAFVIPLSSNDTGVFSKSAQMEYITISTLGDAASFGDRNNAFAPKGSCSNGTNNRGVFGGGGGYNGSWFAYNTIDYITISTPGNALDFGDLVNNNAYSNGVSNS